MGVVIPTYENFLHWYRKFEAHECTGSYARQMVGLHSTKWWRLCRKYRSGEDITKYFKEAT
jgi:macrodomain Ter protein organizer (MatP/YcbG family)